MIRKEKLIGKPVSNQQKKAVITISIIISLIIFIVIGVIFYFGEQEPEISILEDSIKIKGLYGTAIAITEIADISLIEKSMSEIGVGKRTNGYGGFGGTLKGNFKSEKVGETLLFVEAKVSPTIKIEQKGKKDVYISFSDSEKIKELYQELIAKVQPNK